DPGLLLGMPFGVLHDGHRSGHQQPSQIAIALLRYPAEALFPARRILPWHEADPGGEIAARSECGRVGDGGGDCRGADHADARDALEPPADGAGAMLLVDAAIETADLLLH